MTGTLVLGSVPAAGVLALSSVATRKKTDQEHGPVVHTVEGLIPGLVKNGVALFLCVPYAAPTVVVLVWRPPQPVEHWRKPLDATDCANTCPQVTEFRVFAGAASVTEDCLYLNVFALS